jgi:hypothetical protein
MVLHLKEDVMQMKGLQLEVKYICCGNTGKNERPLQEYWH